MTWMSSVPIKIPMWCPIVCLKSSSWLLRTHFSAVEGVPMGEEISLESIYWMLIEENGHWCLVVQPSCTIDTYVWWDSLGLISVMNTGSLLRSYFFFPCDSLIIFIVLYPSFHFDKGRRHVVQLSLFTYSLQAMWRPRRSLAVHSLLLTTTI